MIAILKHWRLIAVGLIVAVLWGMAFYFKVERDHWRTVANRWASEAGTLVIALQQASDNPKVSWDTATGQIVALGESNQALKLSVSAQNDRIDELAADAVRAKAEARELKAIADRAEAQRRSALKRLSDLSITPGTREDCMALLREAEEALDLVREAGA